jgi:small subunit ribosomal protein S2
MKTYIFTERNGIHIIDLQQTLEALNEVYGLVRDVVADGGRVLFVGTKRQAQETIELEATRCGMPYVNNRWLGGTLTNWRTIRSSIDELEELERRRDAGEFDLLTKKEALGLTRRIDKLEGRLGGIRDMMTLPQLLFVVDVRREETAIHEANLLEIPVLALVDTNCDPRAVDYVIPSNDDAIRAIKLMVSKIADAVLEGIGMRKDLEEEEPGVDEKAALEAAVEMTDEELLGEATLAKLKSGAYDERKASEAAEAEQAEPEDEAEPEAVAAAADAAEPTTEEEQADAEPAGGEQEEQGAEPDPSEPGETQEPEE